MTYGFEFINPRQPRLPKLYPFIIGVLVMLLIVVMVSLAHAETIDVERLATAIGRAENSKTHPYGIMAHYQHTTPRQACINTIRHALRDWNGEGDFLAFLQKRYAPIGAANDPGNLNANWLRNVRYYYEKI